MINFLISFNISSPTLHFPLAQKILSQPCLLHCLSKAHSRSFLSIDVIIFYRSRQKIYCPLNAKRKLHVNYIRCLRARVKQMQVSWFRDYSKPSIFHVFFDFSTLCGEWHEIWKSECVQYVLFRNTRHASTSIRLWGKFGVDGLAWLWINRSSSLRRRKKNFEHAIKVFLAKLDIS